MGVADFRFQGKGLEDAERWLKQSMDPKPHLVSAKLWRATYDLCWASAQHAAYLYLHDGPKQEQAKEHWRLAANACFGKAMTTEDVKQKFLVFSYEDSDRRQSLQSTYSKA